MLPSMLTVRQERLALLYLALSVGLLLLMKVFLYDQCYAFDTNDDVNHTFVNLKAARDILRQGELPSINLYNNFGTPLLGDALTFPFALQSITYGFLPDPVAMTVNRAVIGFFAIVVLFLLLRQFLSSLAAMVCSLVVFFSPGQFWNLAHHHYQMSLLCVCALLYVQTRYTRLSRATYLALLWAGYCVLFFSVSIQLALFALPFLLLFLPLKDGRLAVQAAALNVVALAAAVVASWPHTAVFFENIASSTRAQWSPYSGILSTTREQLLALVVPPGEWMHYGINGHFSIVTYFSIAYLVLAAVGILSLLRRNQDDQRLLRLVLVLGLIPAIGGFVLQFHGERIPFVRSIDSTRAWWFSNIFLVLAIGKLLDRPWKRAFPWFVQWFIGLAALAIAYVATTPSPLIPEFTDAALLYRMLAWAAVAGLLAMLVSSYAGWRAKSTGSAATEAKHNAVSMVGKGLIVGVLVLGLTPTLTKVMGLDIRSCHKGNHYFSYSREATFQPQALLKAMAPGYRMASEESPAEGHDLKAVFGGVLGSNARAIVSSQALMDILDKLKLVRLDANYFFAPPWQTELLSRLGIRYLMLKQQSAELEKKNWKLVTSADHLGQRFFLYENPSKASPVYLLHRDKPTFLASYELIPNGIEIELPERNVDAELVVAFSHRPGWRAWVDGQEQIPVANRLGMMQLPVRPENRNVIFRYIGLTGWHFLVSFLLATAMLVAAWFVLRSRKGR